MTGSLTLRIDGRRILVSTDDGQTVTLRPDDLPQGLSELRSRLSNADWRSDCLSASAAASLAEACVVRPRETDWSALSENEMGGLRIPIGDAILSGSKPLADILMHRRSARALGTLTLDELATVLVRAGRVRGWMNTPDGVQLTHRPAPSAGARHPSELLVAALDVSGLQPGWWSFDSLTCALVIKALPELDVAAAAEAVRAAIGADHRPPAVVFLVADLSRTLSRYPAGMSLVWRDAGALLGLLHLCACDVGLGSCIAGLSGILPLESPLADVGALAIGSISQD